VNGNDLTLGFGISGFQNIGSLTSVLMSYSAIANCKII